MKKITMGEFIQRRLVELDNMSQSELARRTGLSQSYINHLIQDVNPSTGKPISPTTDKLQALAKGLKVSPDVLWRLSKGELLDQDDLDELEATQAVDEEDLLYLREQLRGLSPADRKMMIQSVVNMIKIGRGEIKPNQKD